VFRVHCLLEKAFSCIGAVILFWALGPSHAGAKVHIRPKLILEQEYNDNFFSSERDPLRVWVTRVSPGLDVEASTDRSRLEFNYLFSYFWHFSDEDKERGLDISDQDYAGHDLSLSASHRFFTRTTLGLTEKYILTREPAATDRFNQIITRDKYWRNTAGPYLFYDISEKGAVRVGYLNDTLKWEEHRPGQDDYTEDRGILTLIYHLNSTNHLNLDGQAWTSHYEGTSSDYKSYQGMLVYLHDFRTEFSGQLGAGYQRRVFENSTLDDLGAFVFRGGLKGTTGRSTLDVSLARNYVNYTIDNAYFIADRADLYAEHIFLEAVGVFVGGYYQLSDYQVGDREDSTYNGRVGLFYRFLKDIFKIRLEYSYSKRDSNVPGFDYEDNCVFLSLEMGYGFGSK
jgi:hypothetical protein